MRDRNRTDHFIWLENQTTKKDFKDDTIDNEHQITKKDFKDKTRDNKQQNTNNFGKQSETDFQKDHHRFPTTNERR
jgi:hypothetical protein